MSLKKIFWLMPLSFLGYVFSALSASAFCPVCVITVGAGLGLSRWLGIDDVISGLWIGAFLAVLSGWTMSYFRKKNKKFFFLNTLVVIFWYGLTLVPLYFYEIVGHPQNRFLGSDRLVFGATIGTLVFVLSYFLALWLKEKNGGRVYFKLQRVIIPVAVLLLVSIVFYLFIL